MPHVRQTMALIIFGVFRKREMLGRFTRRAIPVFLYLMTNWRLKFTPKFSFDQCMLQVVCCLFGVFFKYHPILLFFFQYPVILSNLRHMSIISSYCLFPRRIPMQKWLGNFQLHNKLIQYVLVIKMIKGLQRKGKKKNNIENNLCIIVWQKYTTCSLPDSYHLQ